MKWRKRRHCPHVHLRGIYGDEITRTPGWRRNECQDCGRLLDGPVLVSVLRRGEAIAVDAAKSTSPGSAPTTQEER